MTQNIFFSLPEDLSNEVVEDLVRFSAVCIERIVSHGRRLRAAGMIRTNPDG